MSEQPPTVKHKTKAKSRYLKGKRERRKQRKALENANKSKPAKKRDEELESDNETEEEMAEENSGVAIMTVPEEEDIEMREVLDSKEREERKARKEKRPKKKRKTEAVDEQEEDISRPVMEDAIDPKESDIRVETTQKPTQSDSTVPIPSFPMPVQPPPASRAQLALQGMDSAMLEAEIIDPGLTDDVKDQNGVSSCLSGRMLKRLDELGITELFAVQTILLPFLLPKEAERRALYQPYNPPQDVCASAPTGSGKTLAYVIPIVEILSTRVITRLRALVILPTRDLVQQVRETFEAFCKGTKLQIASVTGQHSFAHEQAQLVGNSAERVEGGSSRVDILICTPGRLIDHINGTPNFTLQHLRFLVVDEADRLLAQSFQEWLKQVLTAIKPPPIESALHSNSNSQNMVRESDDFMPFSYPVPDALSPAWMSASINGIRPEIYEETNSSCQKLLFSATLTRDPAKIASLELRNPRYIIVRGKASEIQEDAMDIDESHYMETFETPSTLREWMLVCETSNKPLFLFLLAHQFNAINALVFTKSAESTSRLLKLLAFFEEAWAHETSGQKPIIAEAFSSDLAPSQRKSVLERFKQKQIDILICSDLISRGMDIPHVSHVINYDVPIDIRKYIHRVGRTARAGREGDAWSLIEEQEMHHFKVMMKQSNHWSKVKKLKADKAKLEELGKYYHIALRRMKEHYGQSTVH